MDIGYLFTLAPNSPAADRIVKANPRYHDRYEGVECLSFKASHTSAFPGRLISVGRQPGINDVILTENGHAQLQCFFFLVPSGELMLEDATSGHHTYIDWLDKSGKQEKHSLQGDPRSRVIPQVGGEVKIGIVFGQEISFQFKWRIPLGSETIKKKLASIAKATIASNQGMTLTVPRDRNLDPTAYEARTVNTPNVPMEYNYKPLRQIHIYDTIGSGGFGNVFKAVDLRTGSIWAVKECRNPKKEVVGESWKVAFKQEVEVLAQLSHRNIIRLEHHQGWSLGRPVQIFFQLCKGSVHGLLREPHRCFHNPTAPESWVPSFISQALDGLAFIHKHEMVHRDIKPENILYDNGGPNGSMTFYISDFGLTVAKKLVTGGAGTLAFMAPETTRYGDCDSASDVYSFGVTLLEVLGKYCTGEARDGVDEWRAKLKAFNAKHYASYRDRVIPGARFPRMQPGHSRIQSLIDNKLLRKSLGCVLEQDPKRRATATDARRNLLEDYPLSANERHQQVDAAPQPRRDVAPQPRREAAPQPRREVAPQPRREAAPQLRREVLPQPRREAAPRPRWEMAPQPRVVFEPCSEEDNLQPIVIELQPRGFEPRRGARLERRPDGRAAAIPFRPR